MSGKKKTLDLKGALYCIKEKYVRDVLALDDEHLVQYLDSLLFRYVHHKQPHLEIPLLSLGTWKDLAEALVPEARRLLKKRLDLLGQVVSPVKPTASREQKLVDLCFEISLMLSSRGQGRDGKPRTMHRLSTEEKAKWVAKQLADNGFPTQPCGSSWGVLVDANQSEELSTSNTGSTAL